MNLFENLQLMKEADEFTRYKYSGPIYLYNFKNKRQIGEIREPIFTLAKSLRDAYDKFIMGIVTFNTYLIDHQNSVRIDKDKIEVIDSFPDKAEDNLPIIENINMNLLKEENQSDSEHIYKIKFKLDENYVDEMIHEKHEEDKVSIYIDSVDFDKYEIDDENAFIKEFEEWYNIGNDDDVYFNYIKCKNINDSLIEYEISLKNKLKNENEFLKSFFEFFDDSTLTVEYRIDGEVVTGEDYSFEYDGPKFYPRYSEIYSYEKETIDVEFEYKTIEKIK